MHKFNQHLSIGELEANQFKIKIKSERKLGSIHQNSFINYFGLQRFGKGEEVKAGIILLCGKFEEAILALIPKDSTFEKECQREPKTSYKSLFFKNFQKSKEAIFSWNLVPLTKKKFMFHATGSLLWNILCNRVETDELDFIGSASDSVFELYLAELKEIAPGVEFSKELINKRLGKIGMSLESMNGSRRRIAEAENVRQEEENTISFQLGKGTYATMFLRELSHSGIVG